MVVLHVSEKLIIQSHKGPYTAFFNEEISKNIESVFNYTPHFIVDAKVAHIYRVELDTVLKHPNTILIKATEENKSIGFIIPVIEKLMEY